LRTTNEVKNEVSTFMLLLRKPAALACKLSWHLPYVRAPFLPYSFRWRDRSSLHLLLLRRPPPWLTCLHPRAFIRFLLATFNGGKLESHLPSPSLLGTFLPIAGSLISYDSSVVLGGKNEKLNVFDLRAQWGSARRYVHAAARESSASTHGMAP